MVPVSLSATWNWAWFRVGLFRVSLVSHIRHMWISVKKPPPYMCLPFSTHIRAHKWIYMCSIVTTVLINSWQHWHQHRQRSVVVLIFWIPKTSHAMTEQNRRHSEIPGAPVCFDRDRVTAILCLLITNWPRQGYVQNSSKTKTAMHSFCFKPKFCRY